MKKFENIDIEVIREEFERNGEVKPVVGMGVTYSPYTDEYPYHVVEVINAKTIVVEELKAIANQENGLYTGDMDLFIKENAKRVTLKKYKKGWKQNSKEYGSWTIGIASRYQDTNC